MVQVRTLARQVLMAIVACGLPTLGTVLFLNANAPSFTQDKLKSLSLEELGNVEVTRIYNLPQATHGSIHASICRAL